MKEFKYVITDNEGIHARPAGELVKLAKSKKKERKLTARRSSVLWVLEQRKVMK